MKRVVMYQNWHHLLFLHWKVDTGQLRSLIPESLEIDTYDGAAYLGIVLFTMTGVRPRYMPPMPFISAFDEFNVRTYVRNGSRNGVWFFSLDAASGTAARIARSRYHLPYFQARMSVCREGSTRRYAARRNRTAAIEASAKVSGDVWHAQPGSLDHFLIERYTLFTQDRAGLVALEVDHSPYPLRIVTDVSVNESLSAAAGVPVQGVPIAHFADSVSSKIGRLERV